MAEKKKATRGGKASKAQASVQQAMEQYKEMSVAEFFAKNKELAGFANPVRALYQTIRELVENSLDATDTHGILPTIYISIREVEVYQGTDGKTRKRYNVIVEDNGIGVPPTVMADAFGRVLFSSKYVIRQTRGMYGLGVKAAVLYGQMTAGKPVEVISSTRESNYVYMKKLYIDTRRNEPRIVEEGQWRKSRGWHGTRVSIVLEGDWNRARSRIIEYIKRTAVIAPYAEIIFEDPDGGILYIPRRTEKMPKPPKEAKPHPHGIDIEQMKVIIQTTKARTLETMLVREFQSVGSKTARSFLEEIGLSPDMNPKELLKREKRNVLTMLVDALKTYPKFMAPKSDYLSPIGEELIKIGLQSMFSPEWVDALTRSPRAYQGHPFIVEVGIAYGGGVPVRDEPLLLRYANKIPLLYEEREDVAYKVVNSVNWKIYNVSFPAPLVVLVHIASTKIPYKGVGKESVSDVPELEVEIRNAVQEVARRLRVYLGRKHREEEVKRKIVTISKYIPELARSLAILAKPPSKWSPPRPEEEEKIKLSLVRLVAKNVELPHGTDSDAETVVRKIIESAKIET